MSGHPAALISGIRPADRADPVAVRAHLDDLTKPPGSLGRLEALAVRLARIYGDPPPPLRRRAVLLFAADHGVAARGVSAYPPEVTAQMCRNFAAGGAAINAIARAVGADVVIVDVGVDADAAALPGVVSRKVRRGTRDLSIEPAMTRTETLEAMRAGFELAAGRAESTDIFALGDMGIGNTTAAAAVTAALTGAQPESVVGAGTGLDAAGIERKRRVVNEAVARIDPAADPVDVLAHVGGLEIAALAGATLGAASVGRAVVCDGFITTAAALAAVRFCHDVADYLIASHRSVEPGHTVQLAALGLDPLLDLELRLGEGTGAALALPLIEAAAGVLREMATFHGAGVSRETGPTLAPAGAVNPTEHRSAGTAAPSDDAPRTGDAR
ncbi:MAG TPA: nicotinate-nucleotide--dimethylbenzimidazole phosphoribosyltransferase [Longimicrobiales bacterium]